MLASQALKRFLPSGLLQAQAACGSHLGLDTVIGNERSHSYGTESSSPCFHIPTLFGNSMYVSGDRKREDQTAIPQRSLAVAEMLGARRTMGGLAPSFASSRSFHALSRPSSRPSGLVVRGLGLGLGQSDRMAPGTSSALQQTRSLSEGELIGAAYLMTTDIMFWSGLIGAVVFRRNLIVMLLCTEIVMLACNMNFLFASAYLNDMTGVIMSITITTIAACETAIGLALCVTYFHIRSATDVEALNLLK